jgi:GtrA-like protein
LVESTKFWILFRLPLSWCTLVFSFINRLFNRPFFSYHFGRTWVFNKNFDIREGNIISFALVYAIGGVGMSLLIEVMNKKVGLDFQISWIIGAAFAVVNNFLGLKYYVFNGVKNGK